ncbi:unnamed protein product [Cochlearia groenlandica]
MSNQHLISLQEDGLYLLDLNKTTSLKLKLPFTLPSETEPVCILHCRGMICLTLEGNNDLAVWSPGSKDFKKIPMVKPGQTGNLLGFGYDKVSNDYKIVTIIDHKTYVYAFKQSYWRESVPENSLDCKFKNRSGTVLDHCMYWIADRSRIENSPDENAILCFDFSKEEYHELNLPMCPKDNFGSWAGTLKGGLRVIEHYPCLDDTICVWRPDERLGDRITKWSADPWIDMRKTMKTIKSSFDVAYACIARNDEVFIVVKGDRGNREEDKVMVYDKTKDKFVQVSFGCSLKGFRCVTDY